MSKLNARKISLAEVHRLLNLEERFNNLSFNSFFSLEPLTDFEKQELWQICQDFQRYLTAGKVNEGQVKFLALAPLMRLAGFYKAPLEIKLEQDIEDIAIEDEGTVITGQFDILAVNNVETETSPGFWVLVIEAKNSSIEVRAGLPQLLTYAYTSLKNKQSVLGLITNGLRYEFVSLQQGNPATYELLPDLILTNSKQAIQLLQVLKAICQLQSAISPAVI